MFEEKNEEIDIPLLEMNEDRVKSNKTVTKSKKEQTNQT